MPTARYHALLCRDAAGGHSAIALDLGTTGFGKTANDARDDLKEYLRWLHRKDQDVEAPDFGEPELRWFTVSVRPEYKGKNRLYPTDAEVPVRVPCVVGTRKSGQFAADLPLLGLRFDYPNGTELEKLVERYVSQKLEGLTPEEVGAYLPPVEAELLELVVPVPKEPPGGPLTVPPPPTLAKVAEPVGDRAVRKGYARAWGREADLAALVRKLHHEKANVLLVGDAGVGKTTLMVDAVREAEKKALAEATRARLDADEPREQKRKFWLTSAGRIIAGMRYLGQWEERVEAVIGELGEINGVLCAERLLELVRTGGLGPTDSIAAFLVPYLARGELRMIAEVTPAELDACRRLMPGLPDLFQIVRVEPFDRATALSVIDRQLDASASGPGVEVERGTGERIVRLFRRFMPYAAFPGPASGFARQLVDEHVREGKKPVTPTAVVDRFRRQTGLPELFLRDEITLQRDDVRNWFRARVIDQPEACEAATNVVMTVKAGLNDPNRPPAVMLFCGPTGVGKTHMAQALADYFFGHGGSNSERGIRNAELQQENQRSSGTASPHSEPRTPHSARDRRLIRLDMSEYGGFDAVYRLLGPPRGEPGELVKRVRQQPFSVLLLDEIEKAAADVFDTLMGVFDEGRLTDQYGRVTNFRSTIIIMTSNLGAGQSRAVGFGADSGVRYQDAAMKFFRPEFFNRMDAVVTFRSLLPASVRAITRRELESIAAREGLVRSGTAVRWSERLVERLAEVGFDPRYGARPLQRAIEREIVAPLARWLLANPITDGKAIAADWRDGVCVFS
ncbi:AAA family ATPase [Gemmata sp. JC673]|uniref:AAA family ATPase n=1 Tax=Gemmata algarum TaxID=2975278 RepID=A0ABU5ET51_9BACT|nr:AAA family ATPase [Gemmata algarum]MDY3558271.1 AAA family ATPase [Gemmata algarum]